MVFPAKENMTKSALIKNFLGFLTNVIDRAAKARHDSQILIVERFLNDPIPIPFSRNDSAIPDPTA
jgi:hypothetical protein